MWADAERGMIGDFADDLGREGVAEKVDAEEIYRHRCGADGRGDGVDDGGVEGAGIEEEKELRREESGDGEAAGAEEEQDTEGQR